MPELPEVETTGRGVAAALVGSRVERVECRRADLRSAIPEKLDARLQGATLREVTRRAKYLLLRFDNDQTLLVHLGMSGRLLVKPDNGEREKHDHVVIRFSNGQTLFFNDARRFGRIDMMATADEARHPLLAALGPEPLEADFTPAVLSAALKGRRSEIKVALLDQTIVAGIGNIYASEALFYAGISPTRPAGQVAGARAEKLVPAIKQVLQAALAAGGSTLRDYRQSSGELGFYQDRFAVYDRAGQACPGCTCDISLTGGIRQSVQAGRSTFSCPRRQR